jgi:HAD superfamily hydrolase (TIGR01509 family)
MTQLATDMMDITRIKAVAFDCDGVLFDTAQANWKFYDALLQAFDKPGLTREQFHNVHMMTVQKAIAYLFEDPACHADVFARMKKIGYESFIPYMAMAPGLVPLLEVLKQKGFIRAVATNRTNTMARVLKENGLETAFEMVVTAADVKNPKPDPEELLKILAAFDLDPEELIFIGDSVYDGRAAQAAGIWFVAFKNPALSAHAHVDTMDEIQGILEINE